jgi:hypothetical protein
MPGEKETDGVETGGEEGKRKRRWKVSGLSI